MNKKTDGLHSAAMSKLHQATWYITHEADARAAAGDEEAAQTFYATLPFLAEVWKALVSAQAMGAAPLFAISSEGNISPVGAEARQIAELRKMFMVPENGDLLVHAKAVADQWMAVGAPASRIPEGWRLTRTDDGGIVVSGPNGGLTVWSGETLLPRRTIYELADALIAGAGDNRLTESERVNVVDHWRAVGHSQREGASGHDMVANRNTVCQLIAIIDRLAAAPAVVVDEGEVVVEVIGLTGSGKSAVAGEIEILCKALGLNVVWVDSLEEKRLTHSDWIEALEMYKPRVRIIERSIPRVAALKQGE